MVYVGIRGREVMITKRASGEDRERSAPKDQTLSVQSMRKVNNVRLHTLTSREKIKKKKIIIIKRIPKKPRTLNIL